MGLSLVYAFLVLPLAQPFVSGTTTPTTSSSFTPSVVVPAPLSGVRDRGSHSFPSAKSQLLQSTQALIHPIPKIQQKRVLASGPLEASKTSVHGDSEIVNGTSSVVNGDTFHPTAWRKILPLFFNRNDNAERKGTRVLQETEREAGLLSRLFFGYVTPLVQSASQRQLGVDDAFSFTRDEKMEASVTKLGSIYRRLRSEAETQHPRNGRSSADEEAWILSKALFQHQRKTLIYTGVLRLLNTFVQAFPPLLISRLLQLVEQGKTVTASKALIVAFSLLGVLSFKMITENQYFHYIVKSATNVRGSLSGLIFDKALTLPGGGSGVVHPTDGDFGKKNNNNGAPFTNDPASRSIGLGGVLNLMQSDTSVIENAAMQVHTTWDGLLQLAMYTTLLYRFLGKSVVYGCFVLMGTILINSLMLRILGKLAKRENEAKDARTKRTAESITNMKLLKLFGWEGSFSEDILFHRRNELSRSLARGVVRALNTAISNAVPALVLVVTLRQYAKSGAPISAATIFTTITLFNQLRFPLFFYPMLVDSLANGRLAMRRIANFLDEPEIVSYTLHLPPLDMTEYGKGTSFTSAKTSTTGGGSIEMKHGNFLWPVSQSGSGSASGTLENNLTKKDVTVAPALAGVEINVKPGEVVAVVGPVGSGKSALIKGLLGELNPVPGPVMSEALHRGNQHHSSPVALSHSPIEHRPSVITHGQVAYCSQEAWLPMGTIRDAVVFGRDYDEKRYMSAIRDAGLEDDILNDSGVKADPQKGQLSHDTDVGEHGSALSGGQRARVALARALYSGDNTKVFLLDDVLAALDARVGLTVFERLIARLRSQNAAVVLVTNDPSLPRRCDRTILMGKVGSSSSCSTIVDSGSYDDLIARGHDLRSISISEYKEETQNEEEGDVKDEHDVQIMCQDERVEVEFQPARLMTPNTDTIRIVGGGSDGAWRSCHADPESQFSMENCPDSVHDSLNRRGVVPVSDESESIFLVENSGLVAVLNDTDRLSYNLNYNQEAMVGDMSIPSKNLSQSKKLVSADDSMITGAVPISTYVSYFKAARQPLLIAAMLFSFLTVNGAQLFQQYTVARWSEVAKGDAMAAVLGAKYMKSLVNAAGVVSIFLWIRSFLSMLVGVKSSEFVHSRMLSSVFGAPLSFFDSTNSGQLLSRFGKEMETVDRAVPDSIAMSLFCFLQLASSVAALASVITPGLVLPLGGIAILYVKTMSQFRPAARDLKRVETKTRSPIYTHFGEALLGAETIRSIPTGKRYWSKSHRSLTDKNLEVFFTLKSLDRWLSARLENLGNIVVFTASLASIYLTRVGRLKAGSAGWGMTQALSVVGLLTWAVRCLTDLETNMMSVQRVMELTDIDAEEANVDKSVQRRSMPKEPVDAGEGLVPLMQNSPVNASLAPLHSDALLKSGWPWRGNIRFNNVSMRYNPSGPLVLREVSITVPAGSTLGVVGRTGSGKSSLLLTLFRLMEIEPEGSIEIDGVDIRSLSLKVLRQSALAIIPQDPTLFEGTLKFNLDATGRASEPDMWTSLEAASPALAEQFRRDKGLNSHISEGGKNLSQGQRQLICLARALLRRSKILVLDEATSSVDSKTDQAVQETIRREFVGKGVTVITVAHRLETVLGYDNIVVLGAGSVLEYGPPQRLLQSANGELRKLVDADRETRRKGASKRVAAPSAPVTASEV